MRALLRFSRKFITFFKKPNFPDFIPEVSVAELLQQQLDLIPDYYKPQPPFTRSVEYLGQHKFELVLEDLIELALESGHYFSEHYWEALAQIADKLKLPARATYCIAQLRKTKREAGIQIPYGWTMLKLDEHHYQHHIAESIKQSRDAERRRKDKVVNMLRRNGFYWCSYGRAGIIYYVQDGRLLEIGYDIAGGKNFDYIIYFEGATHWALPVQQPITPEEKAVVREQLGKWLGKVRADF
jgi:hypothetical protein